MMDQWTVRPDLPWIPDLSIRNSIYKPSFDIVTVEELIEIDVDHRVKKPEDRLHV